MNCFAWMLTRKLHHIFPEQRRDDVSHMVTMLSGSLAQSILGSQQLGSTTKQSLMFLCQNCKYPNRPAQEVVSMYRASPQVCTADDAQFSFFWTMFRAIPWEALQEIYERIPFSTDEHLVFSGLHYDIETRK